ncbi:MAG: hypothetical protein PVJ57_06880 [Phycisphaerae bacterium]|jgi:hypothetical protein
MDADIDPEGAVSQEMITRAAAQGSLSAEQEDLLREIRVLSEELARAASTPGDLAPRSIPAFFGSERTARQMILPRQDSRLACASSSQFVRLRDAVSDELYKALCGKDRRYRSEVKDLWGSSRLLIAGVAGYVAAKVGVQTAVVAAMTAVVLRLVFLIGKNSFCEYWTARRAVARLPDEAPEHDK